MPTFIRLTSNNDKDKDDTIIYIDIELIKFFKHNNDHDGSYVKLKSNEAISGTREFDHLFVVEMPDEIAALIDNAAKRRNGDKY